MPADKSSHLLGSSRLRHLQSQTYQIPSHRRDIDGEQAARLHAQLMKVQNDLSAERQKNANLCKSIEAEQQQKIEAAFSSMVSSLLCKQIEVHTLAAKNEERERDFDFRDKKIKQLEVYLCEGQKQIKYELDDRGIRPMEEVDREYIRRNAELSVRKNMADMESKITARVERVRIREAAQKLREVQYRALIRDSIESELRANSVTKDKVDEIAELEYNRGFAAGKASGRAETIEEARQKGFLEGYGACHRAQVAVSDMRAGRLRHDSVELDFLFDPGHLHNPYNIGVQLSRLEKMELGDKGCRTEGKEVVRDSIMKNDLEHPVSKSCLYGLVRSLVTILADTTCRAPPIRPTFASELRGPQNMHNGHVVLANSSTSPTPVPTPATGSSNVSAVDDGLIGETLIAGQRLPQFAEAVEENLIDLLG